ncbi:MAG: hypothetical protein Q9217_003922 [Psora testacea]
MSFSASARAGSSTTYPEFLIIRPTSTHNQTFIILHGRGSNANQFGPPLLATALPCGNTLQSSFPHAKFIFPTASRRRAISFGRSTINQWFDNFSPLTIENQCRREDLQYEGLRETAAFIHTLLRDEAALVGARNVVLGGLSQGCAASLVSLLLWQGEPLKGYFGMCGWLPLRRNMEEVSRPSEPGREEENDPFARPEHEEEEQEPVARAMAYLRDELEMDFASSLLSMAFQLMPLFLGHGSKDEKVPVGLGREAVRFIRLIGAEVEWR